MGLLNNGAASPVVTWELAVISILMAFAASHVIALVYVWSHRALSFSQSFPQALVMACVAAALMMLVIGNNVVWGIGMVGAMALVRFRTNLRDSRDMMFVFVALVIGLACGARAYVVVIAGTALFSLIALYLGRISFGFRNYFDALVRFTVRSGVNSGLAQERIARHCSRMALVMVQQVAQGEALEHVYQVRFRRDQSRQDLVRDLETIEGLGSLSLMLEESRVEI